MTQFRWLRADRLGPSIVLALAVALLLCAPSVRADSAPDSAALSVDERLIERLETTRVDVDYAPEDLVRVIEDLRTRHGLNVQVSWGLLDSLGLRRDHRVEIRLRDVSLTVLLDGLLREIDPNGARDLAWGVENGVVVIATRHAIGRRTILRVYDVRDLLESGYALRRFANTPVLGLELTGLEHVGGEDRVATGGGSGGGGFGRGGGGGEAGGIFGSPGSDPTSRMERVQAIVDLIERQVDPESWLIGGGDAAHIDAVDGALLIRQTIRAHQRIAELLALVRDMRAEPLVVDVAFVRLSASRAAEARRAGGGSFPHLPGEWIDTVMTASETDGVLYRGSHPGRNGEAIWVTDISQLRIVTGFRAVVADSAVGLTPTVGVVHEGLELVVVPLQAPGADRIDLDIQMAFKPPSTLAPREGGGPAAGLDLGRERMRTVAGRMAVRIGETAVLSVPSAPSGEGASIRHEDWLVLRVRSVE